jgi:HK97 gp10 family phage protein
MARSAITTGQLSKFDGMQEALANVANILDRTTAERLKDSVFMPAGEVVQRNLKAAAPYDSMHATQHKAYPAWPHLRDSVFLSGGKPSAPNVIVGVNARRAPQGFWREFGTKHQPADPWFYPAVRASREAVAQVLIDGIDQAIQSSLK